MQPSPIWGGADQDPSVSVYTYDVQAYDRNHEPLGGLVCGAYYVHPTQSHLESHTLLGGERVRDLLGGTQYEMFAAMCAASEFIPQSARNTRRHEPTPVEAEVSAAERRNQAAEYLGRLAAMSNPLRFFKGLMGRRRRGPGTGTGQQDQ